MKSIMSENYLLSLYALSFVTRFKLFSILSSDLKGGSPVHRRYITHPRVQQSMFKSDWSLYRVSGALHSLRPVLPVIFLPSATYIATLKSISLIFIALGELLELI